MKCPHCTTAIHEAFSGFSGDHIGEAFWNMEGMACPDCKGAIIRVTRYDTGGLQTKFQAFPQSTGARSVPAEVTEPFKQDFIEASAVLPISAKASAALSRRSLQAILREKAATSKKDLFDQIEEVIASGKMPSHISDGLHAVRNIGNFAAHQVKSKATGAIVEVEVGEAEWNLDILESLFDFYFVEPSKAAKRKAELNVKLKAAGKPELP